MKSLRETLREELPMIYPLSRMAEEEELLDRLELAAQQHVRLYSELLDLLYALPEYAVVGERYSPAMSALVRDLRARLEDG